MASGTHFHGLDTMITVKLQFDGITRRTKMPLRDMVPSALESNIRAFLRFPADSEVVLERYSDSAGRYVWLDPNDVSIYKQLYRAAKAKSKLKIRASLTEQPQKALPKPVTVEDEPEANTAPPTADSLQEEKTPEEALPEEKLPDEEPQQSQADISPTPTPVETTASTSTGTATLMDLPYRSIPADKEKEHARFCKLMESRFDNFLAQTAKESPATAVEKSVGDVGKLDAGGVFCPIPAAAAPLPITRPVTGTAFAVCCNNCEKTIPDVHYHCSTCDDGDFDLCQPCVEQGASCKGSDHWLIKRTIVDGRLINSTTKTLEPKPKEANKEPKPPTATNLGWSIEPENNPKPVQAKEEPKISCGWYFDPIERTIKFYDDAPALPQPTFEPLAPRWASLGIMRTCNCCVQELPEAEFLHCNVCEDYDLCQPCFSKNAHGHHPKHGFSPAVKGTEMPRHIEAKMAPGRNQRHFAICDGCDKNIVGVRHKCLECPDWDFCEECIVNSPLIHPGHRFVPVYEQLKTMHKPSPVHVGICCDGPLCSDNGAYPAYIRGTRFKCAICNDLDFCANCQANPSNSHNKTHPMIMFRTPVRSATILTTDGERNGHPARVLGDIAAIRNHKATEVAPTRSNTINPVQTNVDIKPTEPAPAKIEIEKAPQVEEPEPEVKEEKETCVRVEDANPEKSLSAVFVRDTIRDGTILPSNHVFEQTWVLRNDGNVTWPAGCSVKFVGGDYMGHVDSNHPARISELVSASESTVCYTSLAPGQEFPFTVLLRTPARNGNIVSYWRLTAPSGHKFGDRLWCDVSVRHVPAEPTPTPAVVEKAETPVEPVEDVKQAEDSQASSQMIFPKLEKESPVASIHEDVIPSPAPEVQVKAESEDDEWDISEDGFMTDEEYDILDASDEEYLEEQKKKLAAN